MGGTGLDEGDYPLMGGGRSPHIGMPWWVGSPHLQNHGTLWPILQVRTCKNSNEVEFQKVLSYTFLIAKISQAVVGLSLGQSITHSHSVSKYYQAQFQLVVPVKFNLN